MNTIGTTQIIHHKRSRKLEVHFNDSSSHQLPVEFLRVFSPSAEVQGHGDSPAVLVLGKENITISKIEPIGTYAIRIFFSDGHSSGLYTWEWLYELGRTQEEKWRHYLDRAEQVGYQRKVPNHATSESP